VNGYARLYRQARGRAHRLVLKLRPDSSLTAFQRFQRDGYTALITRGLALTPDSLVLDIGGYLGDYTAEIRGLYGCRVRVLEPVPAFAQALRARFSGDSAVTVHEFGLADEDGTMVLGLSDDGTGVSSEGERISVRLRSAAAFAATLPDRIDVVAINIEGAEYRLIPTLADAGVLERIDTVIVQFHDIGLTSTADRERCREVLGRTHRCAWDYDFVWESWVRK